MVRMKIVLGNKSSHLNSKLNSEIECREFKRLLLDDVILAFTKDEIDAIKKSISTNLTNVQWKSILFEILNITPKSKHLTSPPIDTYVGEDNSANVFLELLNTRKFEHELRNRKKPIQSGESREHCFERIFLPFASTASALVIVDPYFLESIFNEKNGGIWFMKKHMDAGIFNYRIFSRNQNQSFSRLNIEKLFNKLFKSELLKSPIKFKFYLTTPPSRFGDGAHGRNCRYIYSANQLTPAIELEKGTSIFNKLILDPSHNISPMQLDTALNRENAIEFSRFKSQPFEIQVLNS